MAESFPTNLSRRSGCASSLSPCFGSLHQFCDSIKTTGGRNSRLGPYPLETPANCPGGACHSCWEEYPSDKGTSHLSHALDEAVHLELLDTDPDTRSKALAMSSAIHHAGDWLNVIPSSSFGLHLQDWEFRLCLQYWLMGFGVQCVKEVLIPLVTIRWAVGGMGIGYTATTLALRDAYSAAQSAALAPRREVPSLIPGSSSRPADIYLPHWKRGLPAVLDVTVISSIQQLTVVGASTTQGHALVVGEERKLAAHAEACRSVGVTFIPLVAESIGGWSDWAEETIRDIGRLQGRHLGIPPAEATSHLFQRLAICLWRGNAALWIRRMPIRPSSVDGIE